MSRLSKNPLLLVGFGALAFSVPAARAFDSAPSDNTQHLRGSVGGAGEAFALEGADVDELTGSLESIETVLPYQDSSTDRLQSGQHASLFFPDAPRNFQVTAVSSFSLSASWKAPAGDAHNNQDVSAYQVRYSSTVPSMSSFVDFGNATSHGIRANFFSPGQDVAPPEVLNGLEYNAQYFVGIVAYDTQLTPGNPANGSLVVGFSTYTLCPTPQIVSAIGNIATDLVTVTFNPRNPLGKTMFFEIQISESPTFSGGGSHTFTTSTTDNSSANISFQIPDARNQTKTQHVRVRARNTATNNWSPYSSTVTATFTNNYAVLDPIPSANILPTSLTLTWTGSAGNKYQAQYSLTSDFSSFTPGLKELNRFNQTFAPLSENTTHYFRVITFNNNGTVVLDTTTVVSTMTGVSFPSVAVNNVTTNSVTFDINETVPNAHSFRVELSTTVDFSSGISTQSVVAFGGASDFEQLTLGNLIGNTTYYGHIWAINHLGFWESATYNSIPTFITKPAPVSAFTAVTLAPVSEAETKVKFGWGLGNNTAANSRFKVVLSSASNFSLNVSTAIVGPNVFEVLFTTNNFLPLVSNNTYYAKVEVLDADSGRNQLSAALTTSTVTKPIPPQDLTWLSVSTGSVGVGWTADDLGRPNVHNAADSNYEAWQGIPGNPFLNRIGPATIYNATFTFESQNLQPNTTYLFTLRTIGRGGWANEDVNGTTVTWARQPRGMIVDDPVSTHTLRASIVAYSVGQGANNPPGTEYVIECSTQPGFFNIIDSSDTFNDYADFNSLEANGSYFFRAYAINHLGRLSAVSSGAPGNKTLANPPTTVPFNLVDLTTGSAVVNWTHNGNTISSQYRIWVDGGLVNTTTGTAYLHSFADIPTLIPSSTHTFKVETVPVFTPQGEKSAAISTCTLANVPLAPVGLKTFLASRIQFKLFNSNNRPDTQFAIKLREQAIPANYSYFFDPFAVGVAEIEKMAQPGSPSPVWHTMSEWCHLISGTTFAFTADGLPVDPTTREILLVARNKNGIETAEGPPIVVTVQSGYPEVTLTLPSAQVITATDSYAAPMYMNYTTMTFQALGSGHFNAFASENAEIPPAIALFPSPTQSYYQNWSGWNGEYQLLAISASNSFPLPLDPFPWKEFDFGSEGLWFLNIVGDLSTDLGSPVISTSPFRVFIDTTPVDPGTIRAEFGQDATGTPDHTEILPGLPTGHQKPEFFWTKTDTQGKPNPRSPIVGWSWSFSSNPVDTPVLSSAQPQFLPASLFVAASSASYRVFMATYIANFDLVFESTFYFKVAALDKAGNWTPIPSEFQYNYVKDQVPPDLLGFDFPGVEVWTSSPTRYEAVNSTVPVQVIFSELMNFVGGDQAMSIVQTQDHLGNPMGTTIPYTVAWVELPTGTSAVITPSLPGNQWPTGSRFVLHIDGFFTRDLAGNRLNVNYDVLFNTAMDPAIVNIGKSEDGNTTVTFQPGAFGSNPAGAAIADNPATRPVSAAPGLAGTVRKAVETIVKTKGGDYRKILSIKQFELYDLNRQALKTPFNGQVLLTFQYHDVNDNGIVDETEAKFPVKVKDLAIHWLDEKSGAWIKLPESNVDTAAKTVSIPLQHFSVYALIGAPSLDLSNAHPFPVPYKASTDPAGITFTGLSSIATVKIFTLDGRLVKTLTDDSGAGFVRWDPVNNESGDPVASDVYLYVIENDQQRRIGKLMVIR
jgi:hypothetical protein